MADTEEVETTGTAGELSKNAQKKALKAAEAEKKKALKEAEKAAKKAAEPPSTSSGPKLGGDDGEDLDPTQYYENRLKQIANIEVYKLTSTLVHQITCTLFNTFSLFIY